MQLSLTFKGSHLIILNVEDNMDVSIIVDWIKPLKDFSHLKNNAWTATEISGRFHRIKQKICRNLIKD